MNKKVFLRTEADLLHIARKILISHEFKLEHIFEGSGPDGGRDIEAITFETDASKKTVPVKWWIELKFRANKGARLSVKDLESKIHRASNQGVRKFLLITNVRVTASFADAMEETAYRYHIDFRYWDELFLQDQLTQSSDQRLKQLLGNEEITISDRVHDLNQLIPLIRSGHYAVISLCGSGGVGKSALIRYISAMLSSNYDIAWIDCRIGHDLGFTLKHIADRFLDMGVETRFSYSAGLRISESDRIKMLIDHCLERNTLVILDNFEEVLDSSGIINNGLYRVILSSAKSLNKHSSQIIITTRRNICDPSSIPPEDIRVQSLRGFDLDFVQREYLPLLRFLETKISKISDRTEQQQELLAIFDGNPLALQIANQLCAHYDYYELKQIVGSVSGQNVAKKLVEGLSVKLSPDQLEALYKFAQFQRPLSTDEIKKFVCSSSVLDSLLLRTLVEPLSSSKKQFQMHLLTIETFDCSNSPDKLSAVISNLIPKLKKAAKWGTKQIDNMYEHGLLREAINMLIKIGQHDEAGQILIAIGTRAVSFGDVFFLERILSVLENQTSKISPLRAVTAAWLLKVRGHVADLRGQYTQAWDIYKTMLKRGSELQEPLVQAAALNGMGSVERYRNRLDSALSFYTESLALRCNNNDSIGMSNSYHNLGAVYLEQGNYDLAHECLLKAHGLRSKCKDVFRRSATEIYLAECSIHMGKYKEAIDLIENAIKSKQRIKDHLGYVWALLVKIKLSLVLRKNDMHTIQSIANEALQLSEKIRQSRTLLLSNIFCGCAHLSEKCESYDALKFWLKAKDIATSLGNEALTRRIQEAINSSLAGLTPEQAIELCSEIALSVKI